MPRISIITICFNNAEGLKRTAASVRAILDLDVEWIVVDGNSTDETRDLLPSIGATSWVSEPDRGIYDAMNKGLKQCSGEFVMFLNSGDRLHSTSFISLLLRDDFDYEIAYSDIIMTSGGGSFRYWRSGPFKKSLLLLGWMAPHPGFVSRRSLAIRHMFDEEKYISADYLSMLRQFYEVSQDRVYYHKDVSVEMELGGTSNASFIAMVIANLQVLRALREVYGFYPIWVFLLKPLSKIFQYKKNKF